MKNVGITFDGIVTFIDTCRQCKWDEKDIVTELVAFCDKYRTMPFCTKRVGTQSYQEHDNCVILMDSLI